MSDVQASYRGGSVTVASKASPVSAVRERNSEKNAAGTGNYTRSPLNGTNRNPSASNVKFKVSLNE